MRDRSTRTAQSNYCRASAARVATDRELSGKGSDLGSDELAGASQLRSTLCATAVPVPLRATTAVPPLLELLLIVSCPVRDPISDRTNWPALPNLGRRYARPQYPYRSEQLLPCLRCSSCY